MGLAIDLFESAKKRFPPGHLGCESAASHAVCGQTSDRDDRSGASGFVAILPYLEGQSLYDSCRFKDSSLLYPGVLHANDTGETYALDPVRALVITARPSVYVCPSNSSEPYESLAFAGGAATLNYATGTYALSMGTQGISSNKNYKYDNNGMFFYYVTRKRRQISDGTVYTMAVGEVRDASGTVDNPTFASNTCHWLEATRFQQSLRSTTNPLNSPYGTGAVVFNDFGGRKVNGAFGSPHAGGGQFVYLDGHVDFVSDFIDNAVYQGQSTIASGDQDHD